jgi:hypothetical protein
MASTLRLETPNESAETSGTDKQWLLNAFLGGKVDGRDFRHADHVRVAFELLGRHTFPDALAAYSAALKDIATRAGNPGAYHETITVAFLSLIAEHRATGGHADFDAFIADNPQLLNKSILERWYRKERLLSDVARKTFVMPDGERPWPEPGKSAGTGSVGADNER